MSFENIGIGGKLSFDHKGAVTNMGVASRAFARLGQAASNAQAGISRVGAGMSAFSFMGGVGVAGMAVGFKQLVKDGIEWNSYVQSSSIAIGTIISAVTKQPLQETMKNADKVFQRLNVIAAEAPGETQDIVNIFQQMVGPMLNAGASMNEVYDATKGTAIVAGVLHQDFNRTAHAMSMLAGGTMRQNENLIRSLHSMGLLHESTQEWAALLPEQRMKRMKEILAAFNESSKLVGKSWEAQSSTFVSIVKIMKGAFTKTLFNGLTDGLGKFDDMFFANQEEWLAKIEQFGAVFGQVMKFVRGEVVKFYGYVRTAVDFVQQRLDYIDDDRLPGIAKTVAHVVAQFVLFSSAISPVIAIVGFLGAKFIAVGNIVLGLGQILIGLAAPLLPFIELATVMFLIFRRQGESVMDTFARFADYVEQLGRELWQPIVDSFDTFLEAFQQAKATVTAFWQGIQPGLDNFRAGLDSIVGVFVTLWESAVSIFSNIVLGVTKMVEALRPGIEVVVNGVLRVFRVIADGINYLVPKIMAIVEPIVDVVIYVGEKLASLAGKVLSALQPIFDGIAYVLQEVVFPVAGWLIDTAGPMLVGVFRVVGKVIGVIADVLGYIVDAIKWLLNGVGVLLKGAFEAVRDVIVSMGQVIDKFLIGPVKWLGGKLEDIGGAVSGAVSSVGSAIADFFSSGNSALEIYKQFQLQADATRKTWGEVFDGMILQTEILKLQAMGALGIIKTIAGHLMEIYQDAVKPIVDMGASIINVFANAKITSKQPDVKVDVDIKNNATMCVNGRNLAVAQAQYETEVAERAGFNRTPWQTQRVQIAGVKP